MTHFLYGYEKAVTVDDCWRINDTYEVRLWILDTLPDAINFNGDMYLNERDFALLTLRFGPGRKDE